MKETSGKLDEKRSSKIDRDRERTRTRYTLKEKH